MMEKTKFRHLTRDEEARYKKSLETSEEELMYFTFLKAQLNHQKSILTEQLKWELWERSKDLNKKLKQVIESSVELEFLIKDSKEKLSKGVETKEA